MDENYPISNINDYIEVSTAYENPSITAATFDPQQELLWTGNTEGRVTSYYGFPLSKYTSFKVQNDSEVRVLYASRSDDAIFILNADMVSCHSRFGVNKFKHKDPAMQNLQCMNFQQNRRFYLGGYINKIFEFDVDRLTLTQQVQIDEKDCILMKYSTRGLLCTGSTSGEITIRDQNSLKSINKLHPHNGSLSDFDIHGNYLVSCGFSSRLGSLVVDHFLMVYDLRVMKILNPVHLIIEPSFVHYIPMCSSVVAVASQTGLFQLTDTNVSTTPYNVYGANITQLGLCTTFLLSDTCQAAAFTHSSGSIHLFSKGENPQFNAYSQPTLFVDPAPTILPYIDINDEMAPLSSVPVPITNEVPISNWSKENCKYEYRPTPPIDEELLNNARVIHNIMTVPNRFGIKRNQGFNQQYQDYLKKLEEHSIETTLIVEDEIKDQNNENKNQADADKEIVKSNETEEKVENLKDEKSIASKETTPDPTTTS